MACPKCQSSQTTIGYEKHPEDGLITGVNRCIDPECDYIDKSTLVKDERLEKVDAFESGFFG